MDKGTDHGLGQKIDQIHMIKVISQVNGGDKERLLIKWC